MNTIETDVRIGFCISIAIGKHDGVDVDEARQFINDRA
jgi:hypothetical protein